MVVYVLVNHFATILWRLCDHPPPLPQNRSLKSFHAFSGHAWFNGNGCSWTCDFTLWFVHWVYSCWTFPVTRVYWVRFCLSVCLSVCLWHRNISVSLVTVLPAGRLGSIPLRHRVQTGSGAHSYPTGKVKLSLCYNWAPRHEGLLGEWIYNSTHSLTSALNES
jgi:hypothetical protein